MLSLVHKQAY